ncbi:MAG: BufA2 family periplasmic bufferin-type metallophore [Methylococcales bacterium]
MTAKKTSGIFLAAAAAALFMNGAVAVAEEGIAEAAKVHCGGINACKGQSECKTATNACKAQNACKGQGIVTTTALECDEKGGTDKGTVEE